MKAITLVFGCLVHSYYTESIYTNDGGNQQHQSQEPSIANFMALILHLYAQQTIHTASICL